MTLAKKGEGGYAELKNFLDVVADRGGGRASLIFRRPFSLFFLSLLIF